MDALQRCTVVTRDGHVCVLGTREGKSRHLSCVFIRFDISCLYRFGSFLSPLAETELSIRNDFLIRLQYPSVEIK